MKKHNKPGTPIGTPITRTKALKISHNTIKQAEKERIKNAEQEAKQGIQWEKEP